MSIKVTKKMQRVGPFFTGLCNKCTSEYSAEEGDIKTTNDGRNGVSYKRTECTQCGDSTSVVWIKVKDVTFVPFEAGCGYYDDRRN